MPFSWQDSFAELGLDQEGRVQERWTNEVANVKPVNLDEVQRLFPDEKLTTSKSVVYFPYRLCHSAPSFNMRGRGFTPQVLERSIASARHSLIDLDHLLRDNRTHNRDEIIGHIVAARFDPEGIMAREMANAGKAAEKLVLPSQPIPAVALGCLFLRHGDVPDIVREYMTDTKSWLTSMECGVKMKDSAFYYRGEAIPYTEAEEGMLRCVANNHIKPYKGHDLKILLGGVDGIVDFWGSALTTEPADKDADIMAMVAGQSRELANRKTFFMPLRATKFMTRELANTGVDNLVNEMANIAVVGTTEPATGGSDAHVHEILSDGTILPANGHTHSLYNWNLVPGTTPKFTGRTDTHYDYVPQQSGRETSVVHMHMVSVNLRKKVKSSAGDGDTTGEVANLSSELSGEAEMKVNEALAKLDALTARLSSGNTTDKNSDVLREFASLREELVKGAKDEEVKEAVAREIASQIEAGELVKKDEVKAQVDAAVKEVNDKVEAEKKLEAKRNDRLEKVKGLGIDLGYRYDEADEKDTIQSHLDSISLDETGDKEFERAYKLWGRMAKEAKEGTEGANDDADKLEPAMANRGNKKVSTGNSTVKKPNRLLVGSSTNDNDDEERETANTGNGEGSPNPRGKSRFLNRK